MIFEKITGKFVFIEKMEFPLHELSNYFPICELCYIFGNDIVNPLYFIEIENDTWSTHFVFKSIKSNRFAGYLRIISVKKIVEIHGGGINSTFIDKIILSEAWVLIIKKCFEYFKTDVVYTSCMIENKKAFKFITGTGFKEIGRNVAENRITFSLLLTDFMKNSWIKFL